MAFAADEVFTTYDVLKNILVDLSDRELLTIRALNKCTKGITDGCRSDFTTTHADKRAVLEEKLAKADLRVTLRSPHSSELIQLLASNAAQPIFVSKSLLCDASDYFAAAMNGRFMEASRSTLRFPGHTADVVELFATWLFNGPLQPFQYRHELQLLIDAWAFAEEHLVQRLQNDLIRPIWSALEHCAVTPGLIEQVYGLTRPGAKLRRLVAADAACKAKHSFQWLTGSLLPSEDMAPELKADMRVEEMECNEKGWLALGIDGRQRRPRYRRELVVEEMRRREAVERGYFPKHPLPMPWWSTGRSRTWEALLFVD